MQSPVPSIQSRSQSTSPFHDVESSDVKFKRIFLDGKNIIKSKLFEKITCQIKEIWIKIEGLNRMPSKRSPEPSPFIRELIVFFKNLQTIFDNKMVNEEFKNEIYNISLNYLTEEFLKILINTNSPSINIEFAFNIVQDIKCLDDELLSTLNRRHYELFNKPRQLFALISSDNPHEFMDPVVRNRKYSSLNSVNVVKGLERLKEPAAKRRLAEDLILLLR